MAKGKEVAPKGFLAWLLGVVNHRIDCPKCGGFRTGILIGEWGGEMRECSACKHYWEQSYSGEITYQHTELELDSILQRKLNGGLE